MKVKYFLFICLFITTQLIAQKEASNWFFGVNAGLNFNSGVPTNKNGSTLISNEGCATISDRNGNLLFYSDGNTIWNRNHDVLLNGDNLLGHHSSTQAALIIPKPGSRTLYYVLTVDKPNYYLTEDDPISGLNYSLVDMTLDGGLGGVITNQKNQHLLTYNPNNFLEKEFKCSEKITAVLHADGISYWAITHFVDRFYAFKIDANGIQPNPTISTTGQTINPAFDDDGINKTAIGYLKASPNGEKLAIAHSSTTAGSPRTGTKKSGKVFLYNFNATTGAVTSAQNLISSEYPYGVEFSPKSEKLYITSSIFNKDDILEKSNLYQFNLSANDVKSSKKIINTSSAIAGALQLAIDGKIYRATNTTSLSVIKNPEELGNNCNYIPYSLQLDNKSTLGLPPFIQSFFLFNFNYEYQCYGDTTNFYITSDEPFDSVLWNFGDGHTSTIEEPQHTYSNSGTYEVSLTKYIANEPSDKIIKPITIFDTPNVNPNTFELIQCDSQDANSQDGLSTFNLEAAIEHITSEPIELLDFYFYTDKALAENDINNFNSISNIYSNNAPEEIIFAKLLKKGSDCFSIASIKLIAHTPIDISISPFYSCEIENNQAEFNLRNQKDFISQNLGLPQATTQITFHETEQKASLIIDPLPDLYLSSEKTIYAKITIGDICYGIGAIELIIHNFPEIEEHEIINNCFNNFPLELSSEIENVQQSNFSFNWNTGSSDPEITVNTAGTYTVLITHLLTGCSKIKEIEVIEIPAVQIKSITIEEQTIGHEVTVILENRNQTTTYEFAMNDVNSTFQNAQIFNNIPAGYHTLYVKDNFNCSIVEKDFFILGYPKFLTPNNDGENDTWQIQGYDKNTMEASDISIFDRYGKLIVVINPLGSGWDGLYNGKNLTTNEFWFKVALTNERGETIISRGHFSLIRR
ncbi:T9SS type B sorting domain-containing protein [Urechidicola vernalis]|uniref:T9SS type B sorting domain-containing protein n=1 Tax=Urechidicola vernalis TaxID=3075600 RepID=A0ABU2Y2S4_9FLAO|nr:T9SS type B sorting domain-containing protein [Urechidicola sp. P050]MDT0552502.1 T9SS type B sorting domain-containing protein [Urechidicola sp. P050]